MKKSFILGVIPARGGSKGIPRKNIKPISGKPLIAWTIKAAKKSKLLDRFVVSTEDAEIASIARKYGAEIIDRPDFLATDRTAMVSVLRHVLSVIKADAVVLLQPTSPVRDPGLIDRCVMKFKRTKADNLATGFICKFRKYGSILRRKQEIDGFFYDDGNVYVIKAELIKKGKFFGKKICRLEIDREQNVDIDDGFDFWLAEQILNKRIKRPRRL